MVHGLRFTRSGHEITFIDMGCRAVSSCKERSREEGKAMGAGGEKEREERSPENDG